MGRPVTLVFDRLRGGGMAPSEGAVITSMGFGVIAQQQHPPSKGANVMPKLIHTETELAQLVGLLEVLNSLNNQRDTAISCHGKINVLYDEEELQGRIVSEDGEWYYSPVADGGDNDAT